MGHQGQGARRARCTNCSAGRRAIEVRVYAHARSPETIKEDVAKGFTAFKTGPRQEAAGALHRDARRRSHYAAEKFAELRKAAGDDVRHRHRLPRRHQPGDGEGADQGDWSRYQPDVHRGALPTARTTT